MKHDFEIDYRSHQFNSFFLKHQEEISHVLLELINK